MMGNHAPVAQLDRVPGYELGGREFESLRVHQNFLEKSRNYAYKLITASRSTVSTV